MQQLHAMGDMLTDALQRGEKPFGWRVHPADRNELKAKVPVSGYLNIDGDKVTAFGLPVIANINRPAGDIELLATEEE